MSLNYSNRLFRNHWSVENGLHHVKDRGWDENVHKLRRPGLGEVYATLVNPGRISERNFRTPCWGLQNTPLYTTE